MVPEAEIDRTASGLVPLVTRLVRAERARCPLVGEAGPGVQRAADRHRRARGGDDLPAAGDGDSCRASGRAEHHVPLGDRAGGLPRTRGGSAPKSSDPQIPHRMWFASSVPHTSSVSAPSRISSLSRSIPANGLKAEPVDARQFEQWQLPRLVALDADMSLLSDDGGPDTHRSGQTSYGRRTARRGPARKPASTSSGRNSLSETG
jgi:hypothetical protein